MKQQQLSGTRLYIAFIDFKKAYDSVDRAKLSTFLEKKGVSVKFVCLLQSLYDNTRCTIHWHGGVTPQMPVVTGVQQGCPLFLILFALFTSDIPNTLNQHSKGVQLGNTMVTNLLYANDTVLLSDSSQNMIQGIHSLNLSPESKLLSINCTKSNLLRFGLSTRTPVRWPVYNSDGHTVGTIQEALEVTYLGI